MLIIITWVLVGIPLQTRGHNWHFLPCNGHKVTGPHSSSDPGPSLCKDQRGSGVMWWMWNVMMLPCDIKWDLNTGVNREGKGNLSEIWLGIQFLELTWTNIMYVNFVKIRIIFQILLCLIFYVSAPGHLLVLSIWLTYWTWSLRVSVTIKYNLTVNISHKGILGHESAKNSRLYLLLKLGSGCHLSRGSGEVSDLKLKRTLVCLCPTLTGCWL